MRDLTRRMITTAAVILGAGSLALFLTGSARVWTSAGFAAALVLLLIVTNTLDVYMACRARRERLEVARLMEELRKSSSPVGADREDRP